MSETLPGTELLANGQPDDRGATWAIEERLSELVGIASAGERYSSLDDPELVQFTAAISQRNYRYNGRFASVAVVNPNAFPIYVALGMNATPGSEIMIVDPFGWVVLPIVGDHLTLNSNGQVGSVYVLPLKLAQPFAKGGAGGTGPLPAGVTAGTFPIDHPYAKGKAFNAVSVPGAGLATADLVVSQFAWLKIQVRMTAAVAGDLAVRVLAYEDDATTVNFAGDVFRPFTAGPNMNNGEADYSALFQLGGAEKVQIRINNSNAAAQTVTCVYFLQK